MTGKPAGLYDLNRKPVADMDKLKTILTVIAVILGALAVLAVIGFIYTALGYILILGVICLAGYVAIRLFGKSDDNDKQLSAPDPKKQLEKVQRLLDQYKQK